MKRLTLVRHAKSDWGNRMLSDSKRPLSDRGERDAPIMGARLAARESHPSVILCSPAKRAVATAQLIGQALGYPAEQISIVPELYLATPEDMLEVIAVQDDAHEHLMLIGHNPGLTDLVNRLLPELALPNLPTAGIVALDYPVAHWREATHSTPRLLYYDYPKNSELMLIED
jgi:phosphohistidine phosphatase